MKVTPNSTMVAPQDDLDLNLVTSRTKRFLKKAIKTTLAHYKKVDHKNRHSMKKGEANTKAACLIINLFNKNGKARIVADKKSGLYNVTPTNKRTSKNGNCKAAKSNGKNTRSPDMKKTKTGRQEQQENTGLYNITPNNKRTSQNGNCKAAKSNGKNTRSPAKKKTKPARQTKQENTNFNFVNNCPDCKFAQKEYKLTNH
jgi:hypothetical protein